MEACSTGFYKGSTLWEEVTKSDGRMSYRNLDGRKHPYSDVVIMLVRFPSDSHAVLIDSDGLGRVRIPTLGSDK